MLKSGVTFLKLLASTFKEISLPFKKQMHKASLENEQIYRLKKYKNNKSWVLLGQ